MSKKKAAKPDLRAVPDPPASKSFRLSPEEEAELKEMIRQINAKSKAKREAEQKDKPHTEHDPNLPPAA